MAGGGPERYHNVNPLTDQGVSAVQSGISGLAGQGAGAYNQYVQSMGAIPTNIQAMQVGTPGQFDLTRLSNAEGALMGAAGQFDPMAQFSQIGQVAPLLQDLAGPSSGYEANLMQQAQRASDMGIANVANQFSGMGGVFSGAGQAAMTEAAVNPFLQAQGQIMNLTNQNYQGLLGQGLNQLAQGNQFGANLGMQAGQGLLQGAGMGLGAQQNYANLLQQAQMANQGAGLQAGLANQSAALERAGLAGNMYGNILGNQTALQSLLGQMATPEMIYQPTVWESIIGPLVGGGIQAGAQIGGAALGAG
jgi:hypothetical protein